MVKFLMLLGETLTVGISTGQINQKDMAAYLRLAPPCDGLDVLYKV